MEIVGGFMVMMSILGLFLAVIWLIMPFVVFAIKGKQDRTLDVLEAVEKRLATIEAALQAAEAGRDKAVPTPVSTEASPEHPLENAVILSEPTSDSKLHSS